MLCVGTNGCGCAIQSGSLSITGSGTGPDPWVVETLGARTFFTPALTASSVNPNLGSTGSAVGQYSQEDDLIFYEFVFAFTGTGTTAGSGTYTITKPGTANLLSGAGETFRGGVRILDGGTSNSRDFKLVLDSLSNNLQIRPISPTSYASSTVISSANVGTTFPANTFMSGQCVYHVT